MSREGNGEKLKPVGAIWKPREGAKSKGSGSVTIRGYTQRFVILANRYKEPGSKQPDYVLMSSEGPTVAESRGEGRRQEADSDAEPNKDF